MSSTLPPPDPSEGNAAEIEAAEARRTALAGITDGSLTLDDLFGKVDTEGPRHQLGHIHAKALLVALPKIGDVKADKILDDLGIKHDEHIDVIGVDERAKIVAAVAAE